MKIIVWFFVCFKAQHVGASNSEKYTSLNLIKTLNASWYNQVSASCKLAEIDYYLRSWRTWTKSNTFFLISEFLTAMERRTGKRQDPDRQDSPH